MELATFAELFTDPKALQELSEALSGVRPFTFEQVKSLASYFGVPADVFFA